jgi:hypothetical protein
LKALPEGYVITGGDASEIFQAAAPYRIEAEIRGKDPAQRLAARQEFSRPLVKDLRLWFEAQLKTLPAKGPPAEVIRYPLNHWDGLERFFADGSIEIDNNTVERCMRPIKLSTKNALFAGPDEGAENWAAAASLIETCKLNNVNPQTYFTDLLTRIVHGWPQSKIDELMPWCSKPSAPTWSRRATEHRLRPICSSCTIDYCGFKGCSPSHTPLTAPHAARNLKSTREIARFRQSRG